MSRLGIIPLSPSQRTSEPIEPVVNGLHLCNYFLTSGHSKIFTILANIHPFTHTFTPRRRCQPCKATSKLVGSRGAGCCSCSGTPRHSHARRSRGSNRQPSGCRSSEHAVPQYNKRHYTATPQQASLHRLEHNRTSRRVTHSPFTAPPVACFPTVPSQSFSPEIALKEDLCADLCSTRWEDVIELSCSSLVF